MSRSAYVRVALTVFAAAKLSIVGAQDFDPTPVYEALFAQAELLGTDKTYYVREGVVKSRYGIPREFHFPSERASHVRGTFGRLNVVIIEESYVSSLWDSGCEAGWEDFHRRYADADDLTQVSQVALNVTGEAATVYVSLGRGCLHAWAANFRLENREGQWVITRIGPIGET